jgi:hypothetical protein
MPSCMCAGTRTELFRFFSPLLLGFEYDLGLLLRRSGLGLGGLLLVAADHDHAEKGAHDGGAEEDQDNGDADGPDTGEEEVLERVAVVDKGQEKGPGGVIEEDDGGGHEHGESDEFVQLVTSHGRHAVSSVFSQGWAAL